LFTNPTLYGDARAFQGGFRWVALTALVVLATYLGVHLHASLIRARFLLLSPATRSSRSWSSVPVEAMDRRLGLPAGRRRCAAARLQSVLGLVSGHLRSQGSVGVSAATSARRAGRGVSVSAAHVLLDAPAFALLGDVRYTLVALTIAAAWLFARPCRKPRRAGGASGPLHPRTLFVLEQAFTEPLVIFCFALTIHAIARREHWAMAGAALGLLARASNTRRIWRCRWRSLCPAVRCWSRPPSSSRYWPVRDVRSAGFWRGPAAFSSTRRSGPTRSR